MGATENSCKGTERAGHRGGSGAGSAMRWRMPWRGIQPSDAVVGPQFLGVRDAPVVFSLVAFRRDAAPVAQRIEHLTTDQKVWGSNPYGRTHHPRLGRQVRSGVLFSGRS